MREVGYQEKTSKNLLQFPPWAVQQWINHFDSFWKQKIGKLEQLMDAEKERKKGG